MGKVFLFVFVSCSSLSWGRENMILHVTNSSGGFSTEIRMRNPFAVGLPYKFTAFDKGGSILTEVEGILGPLLTKKVDSQVLFGVDGVSHFKKSADTLISIQVAYQAKTSGAGISHAPESNQSSQEWMLFPGDPNLTWDGFAVVNLGNQTASISVSQFDEDYQLMKTVEIQSSLNINAKALYVLSSGFDLSPENTHFRVQSNQSIGVIALRGTNDNTALWKNLAVPISLETGSLKRDGVNHEGGVLHITNLTGGFNTSNALHNTTSKEVTITIKGTYPSPPGGHVEVTKTVPPEGALYFFTTQDLFPDRTVVIDGQSVTQRVSHITVPPSDVLVTATYIKPGAAPAVVKPSVVKGCSDGIVSIHQFNGATTENFGMAYINIHTSDVSMVVNYLDANGNVIIGEEIGESLLGPDQKRLFIFKPPEGTVSWQVEIHAQDGTEPKQVNGAFIGLTFNQNGGIIIPAPAENICDQAPEPDEITEIKTEVEGFGGANHFPNGDFQVISDQGTSSGISYGPSTITLSENNTTCYDISFTNGPLAGQQVSYYFLWLGLCNGWFMSVDALGNIAIIPIPFSVVFGLGCTG